MNKPLNAYKALIAQLSGIEKNLLSAHRRQITCSKGCFECCKLGSAFAVEAAVIRKASRRLSGKARGLISENGKKRTGYCPYLIGGACSIYVSRPVICRTHGYPLMIGGKITFCGMNFKKVKTISANCITDLGRLNVALAAINIAYLKATGEKRVRIPLRSIIKEIARG